MEAGGLRGGWQRDALCKTPEGMVLVGSKNPDLRRCEGRMFPYSVGKDSKVLQMV